MTRKPEIEPNTFSSCGIPAAGHLQTHGQTRFFGLFPGWNDRGSSSQPACPGIVLPV
jgi:hypothetical protein